MNELLSLFTQKILKDNDTKSARYAIGVLAECMRELDSGETNKSLGIQTKPPYTYTHGQKFKAYIEGLLCEGKVSIDENTQIFLCQNTIGISTSENEILGFKYIWIDKGTKQDLEAAKVENLLLYPL